MTSQFKTVLLLALLSGLLIAIGGAAGGRSGVIVAFGVALLMNIGSYWFSDSVVLRMYRARVVEEGDAPMLHRIVSELAHNAGVPKPRVCIIPEEAPNAFATGRDPAHGVVAVTDGILRLLSPEELRGVLGHEMAHIAHRDILIQTVAGVIGSAITMLANMLQFAAVFGGGRSSEGRGNPIAMLAMAMLAPIAASLIQFAISRSREYMADAGGAKFSGQPLMLASALEKLQAWNQRVPMRSGSPTTEQMFIVTPLFGRGGFARMFSTHPPIEERVERLHEMAESGNY